MEGGFSNRLLVYLPTLRDGALKNIVIFRVAKLQYITSMAIHPLKYEPTYLCLYFVKRGLVPELRD